ncbi:16S rRNA (adenine(1518)-N(6)/adenine(1519)-N(6))-dimethyltransferaseRsmA [soil metagenome]
MSSMPYAKKSLGQHWLTDAASLEAICDAAAVVRGDVVLEIGPGTGELTAKLLERGAEVTALEIDVSLKPGLEKRFAKYNSTEFYFQEGDIRTYDLSNMPDNYKIVANIPYYLSAYLLRLLTESLHKPKRAALLLQKEVAERVAAEPGDMSVISVASQLFYEVYKGWIVPAKLFTPAPKVDSRVLILQRREKPLFDIYDHKAFFRIVKSGFSARRKTLLNSLSGGLRLDKPVTEKWLIDAGVNPADRPQDLSIADWHRLYRQQLL